jgi:hypothetical protein
MESKYQNSKIKNNFAILKSLFLVLLYIISTSPSPAQDGAFTASVDRNRIAMGEQLEITFSLNGSGKNFQPPAFNDFLVLSGPNQSTSMQFINGAMSQSISYSYVLQPRSEGKFTIGAATIESNGKKVQSNSITIEVTKGSPQQKKQQSQQTTDDENINKQIAENLFIKVIVDKSNVYQGEQITATYKLYTRVNIANSQITKVPALTGFWNQEIDIPKNTQETEVLNGVQFRVIPIKKYALFPQQSGTLELDPMEADFVVQVQTRKRGGDVWDQFFNDPFFGNVRNVNYPIKSIPIKIIIKPLPSYNVPEGFSGAVGKLSFESWLDKRETKTNEPVTLKVKISGRGNLKLIDPLKISFPPDLESYDPKISDNITTGTSSISGSRTFEYLLVPRRPGEQKIAPFNFSYFDLDKKDYVSIKSPEFLITVSKGSDYISTPIASLSKEEIKLFGQDIRFIKSGTTSFKKRGENFFGSPGFFILLFSPIFLFVWFISYIRHYEKISGDVVRLKSRKATRMAKKRLLHAEKFLAQKKREEFYSAISQALWGYAGDKLGIPLSDLSKDSIKITLTSRNVNDASIEKLINTINHCEFARFAPSTDSLEMEIIYKDTIELITSIEEELR